MRKPFPLAIALSALIVASASLLVWWRWAQPSPNVALVTVGTAALSSNVVVITIDTLRPDRLSSYGYRKHETPSIDRLAREGVLFENAFCDVTWTTPSMTSVMTGRYATVHKVRTGFEKLSDQLPTLAELLRATDIHTAAVIASYPLASIYGLNRGFDLYDESFNRPFRRIVKSTAPPALDPVLLRDSHAPMLLFILRTTATNAYRPDDEISDRAIRWLRDERREPFFLWVHYLGPHEKPLPDGTLPIPAEGQAERYDADVVATDQQVGRVLDALDELGLSQSTAVVLHADHGEALMEHKVFGHGYDLYDVTQRVPLLVRLPGGAAGAGRHVVRLARNLDLFPTILELLGVATSVPVDGVSLVPLIRGERIDAPEETYAETYLSATSMFAALTDDGRRIGVRRLGLRTPKWKFIISDPIPVVDRDNSPAISDADRLQHSSEELYDVSRDPGELRNVIADHPDLAATFRERVAGYQNLDGGDHPSVKIDLDADGRERLRSLGYLK